MLTIPIEAGTNATVLGLQTIFLNVNQFLNAFLTLLAVGCSVEPTLLTPNKNNIGQAHGYFKVILLFSQKFSGYSLSDIFQSHYNMLT